MNTNIRPVKLEVTIQITQMRADVEKGALAQAEYERMVAELMRDPNSFVKEG